jgi:3-dehydroquinate synthetase
VPPGILAARLRADPVERPTFMPYDVDRLAAVLRERAPMYRAADLEMDGSIEPTRLAEQVIARRAHPRGRRLYDAEVPRHHPIGPETTRVVLGADLDLGEIVPPGVAVVDARAGFEVPARARLEVRGGERAKRIRHLERTLEWLAAERVERTEALIAVGGGTVGDLTGTAAALYARGIPLVHVPTTWLAQADSAHGGKVAVDLRTAKNAVGAFWPPVLVASDVAAIRTLPVPTRRDGMAESVKSAIIGDETLWTLLEARGAAALDGDEAARHAIIERSARVKLAIVERDPFEAGERRRLNLGHTLGHALEIESGYRLPHGAAVALGMRAVATIATRRGGDPQLSERLDALLRALGFRLRHRFEPATVRAAMTSDKKRIGGRQRWILPMAVGRVVEADDVTDAEIGDALRAIGE